MARAHDEACVQVFFVRNGKIVGREHFILEGVMDSTRESILMDHLLSNFIWNKNMYLRK